MKDLKIDEDYLGSMVDISTNLMGKIMSDIVILNDKDADVFLRFMAFNRIRALHMSLSIIMDVQHMGMLSGHCLQDSFFHTKEGKQNNWHESRISEHPFFCQKEKEGKEKEDLEQHKKEREFFMDIIKMMQGADDKKA